MLAVQACEAAWGSAQPLLQGCKVGWFSPFLWFSCFRRNDSS